MSTQPTTSNGQAICGVLCIGSMTTGVNSGLGAATGAISTAAAGTIGAATGAIFGAMSAPIDFAVCAGLLYGANKLDKVSPKLCKALTLATPLISTIFATVVSVYLLSSLGFPVTFGQAFLLSSPLLIVKYICLIALICKQNEQPTQQSRARTTAPQRAAVRTQ